MTRAKAPDSLNIRKPVVKKPRAADELSQMAWGGFINIRMSEAHRSAFPTWALQEARIAWDGIHTLLAEGGKITLTHNPINDTNNASLTGQLIPSVEKRFTLSCFAPSWQEALSLLAYKFFVVADGDLEAYQPDSPVNTERFG